jgi:nuclear pore complex protein Nup160
MCDNDHIDRLVSLNFIGYQSEVEETLSFKARNADPRKQPHYGEVLHAWYVFRGDFRSGEYRSKIRFEPLIKLVCSLPFSNKRTAAAAMYQQGRRLADITYQVGADRYEVVRLQAKSYLAAINALSLVDQQNAWIQYMVSSANGSQVRSDLQGV